MSGLPTVDVDVVRLRVTLAGPDVPRAALAYQLETHPRVRRQLYLLEHPREGTVARLVDRGITAAVSHDRESEGTFQSSVTITLGFPARLALQGSALRIATGHRLSIEGEWTVHQRRTLAILAYIVGELAPHERTAERRPPTESDTPRLFSGHQRRFLNEAARIHFPALSALQPYGPIAVECWHILDRDLRIGVRRLTTTVPTPPFQLLDMTMLAPIQDAAFIFPALTASVRRHGLDPDAFVGSRTGKLLDQLQH
jgi:hypothetical protein